MPKIKLTKRMIRRLYFMLGKEINVSKKNIENISIQVFAHPENKKLSIFNANTDLDFLEGMKEVFDSEIFGENG